MTPPPSGTPSASDADAEQELAARRRGDPYLVYRDHHGRRRVLSLPETWNRVVVGRSLNVDLVLSWDEEVSGLHAELQRLGDDWLVVDDGLSRNGSFVNGQRVSGRRRLRDGDRLCFGSTEMRFQAPFQSLQETVVVSDLLAEDAASTAREAGLARDAERPARAAEGQSAPGATSTTRGLAQLRREGDVWAFECDDRSLRVRDSKGVRCLAALLANPGIEIHALELAELSSERASPTPQRAGPTEPGLAPQAGDDAGPLLDAEAKAAYRQRLEDLHDQVDEAESLNDPERAARARAEMDFLVRELAGAVGLGGRDRKAASNAERARVSVTKAIRATLRRIAEHDPVLGRELTTTIRTGTFCAYEPDPRHPLDWRLQT